MYTKTTNANQKVITVRKHEKGVYGVVNKDNMFQAMRELKYNEFKIYMYLITNQNGFRLELSTKHIANMTGASQRKIQESVNTLIEKGYLVLKKDTTNEYIMHDNVQKVHRQRTKSTQTTYEKYTDNVQKVHSNNKKNNKNIINNNNEQQVAYVFSLYPNKKGKSEAIKKIPRLIEKYGYEKIIECVEAYAEECRSKNIDNKYIKYASTFFNSGYLDYLENEPAIKYYYEEDPVTGEQIRRRYM